MQINLWLLIKTVSCLYMKMQRHKKSSQVTFAPGTKDDPSVNSFYQYKQRRFTFQTFSNNFTALIIGLSLIAFSIFMLVLNETGEVYSTQRVQERLNGIVRIPSSDVIFQENNNKIVHISGSLRTVQPLVDGQYGVSVHAVKLRREVQMYQWVEHKEFPNSKDDSASVYTKEWRSHLVDSDSFVNPHRHQNRKDFPMKETTYVAAHAYIGNYYIKESIKEKIETFKPLPPLEPNNRPDIKLVEEWFYAGRDPLRPNVGDTRVKFSYAGLSGPADGDLGPPDKVSLIAKQISGHLTKYLVNKKQMEILHYGEKTPEEMITEELKINTSSKWYFRIGTAIFIFGGLLLSNSLVYKLASTNPYIQDFFLSQPLALHLILAVLIVMVITTLSWLSLTFVFIGCLFIVAFIPFLIIIRVEKSGKNSNASV